VLCIYLIYVYFSNEIAKINKQIHEFVYMNNHSIIHLIGFIKTVF